MSEKYCTINAIRVLALLAVCHAPLLLPAQQPVTVVGQMRNVMWKGELQGTLRLDTLSDIPHLYGLGPVEFLTGEILLLDGHAYIATVWTDTTMRVEETFRVKAPFFGYASVPRWTEHNLPDSIRTLPQLERYLDRITASFPRPFFFRLEGTADHALIHVVNLPGGAEVHSPDDAHRGQRNYRITAEPVEILGFFSTTHQAIFTHHDTFLHCHLITADHRKMGHLDEVMLQPGTVKLFLPAE